MSAAYVQASSLVDMATALSRKGGGARTYRMYVDVGHLLLSFLWVGFGFEREPHRVRLGGEPGVWVRPTRVCMVEQPIPSHPIPWTGGQGTVSSLHPFEKEDPKGGGGGEKGIERKKGRNPNQTNA